MNLAMKKLEAAHIFALSEELYEYRKSVLTLLENGRPLLEQAYGETFQKLYFKRRELWNKIATINKCINILYKHTL